MGLEVNANAASLDIRQIYYFEKNETVKPQIEPQIENLPTEIFRNGNENPNDVYASRTGLSTALNPLTLRTTQTTKDVSDTAFDGHLSAQTSKLFSRHIFARRSNRLPRAMA